VRLPDIFLLESEGNYTRVWFASERPLIRRSLNTLEEDWTPPCSFRASRKQIVNLKWMERWTSASAGGLAVTLRGGLTVEMSRRQSVRLRGGPEPVASLRAPCGRSFDQASLPDRSIAARRRSPACG